MTTPSNLYTDPQQSLVEDNLDIKRYMSLFLSNWYWFAVALFIALSIAYVINRYSEKIYTVNSTLLIKDDQLGGGISGAESFMPGWDFFKNKQNLKNEIGILKSYSLNKMAIDSLPGFHITYVALGRRNIVETRLYNGTPFYVIPDSITKPNITQPVFLKVSSKDSCEISFEGNSNISQMIGFGDSINWNGFTFRILLKDHENYKTEDNGSNKFVFWFESVVSLANNYRSRLGISPIDEDASIVLLTLSGPVAEQEADYLNELMETYIEQGLELKNRTADATIVFIEKQLVLIWNTLDSVENELQNFRKENRLIDMSKEGSIIQARLEKFDAEKTALNLQKDYYNYLISYLAGKNQNEDIVSPTIMGVSDPLLIKGVETLAELKRQRKQMELNLNSASGPMKYLEKEIEKAVKSLNETVDGGMKNISLMLTDVNKRISEVELDVSKLPSTEREMIIIQRKFDINNTVYTYLLEKKAEAGIAKASTVSDNRIIDRAGSYNATLIKPKSRQNYVMAIAFGFFVPIILILLIDFLNNKIIDRKDVERGTNVPIIGYISHNDYRSEIPVNAKPGSTLAESFRSVRTNLKYFLKDKENPVIAISSTISAEGKTFISINLATIIASLGKKVLLIGLDLRKPRIHSILGIENDKGMSSFLSGQIEYEEVIQSTSIENLYYATAGHIPPNPAELIESDKLGQFIEKARKEFDFVIIDTPPIAIVTDALLVARLVDFCLLVVRQRYSSKNTLDLIQELHNNATFKSIGIVINDISLTGYYGYGLRYGYSIGAGYYYGYNYYNKGYYGRYGYSNKTKEYYTD